MSKTTQRKQSAFEEGRKARREAEKLAHYPFFFESDKNGENPYSKKTGLRTVWNAGWMEQERNLKENK